MNSNRLPWSAPWMTNKEATRLSLLGSDATSRANDVQACFRLTQRHASVNPSRERDRLPSSHAKLDRIAMRLIAGSGSIPAPSLRRRRSPPHSQRFEPVLPAARWQRAMSRRDSAPGRSPWQRRACCKAVSARPAWRCWMQRRRCCSYARVGRAEQAQIALAAAARVGPRLPGAAGRATDFGPSWIGIGFAVTSSRSMAIDSAISDKALAKTCLVVRRLRGRTRGLRPRG